MLFYLFNIPNYLFLYRVIVPIPKIAKGTSLMTGIFQKLVAVRQLRWIPLPMLLFLLHFTYFWRIFFNRNQVHCIQQSERCAISIFFYRIILLRWWERITKSKGIRNPPGPKTEPNTDTKMEKNNVTEFSNPSTYHLEKPLKRKGSELSPSRCKLPNLVPNQMLSQKSSQRYKSFALDKYIIS